jgi:hypothetical protein
VVKSSSQKTVFNPMRVTTILGVADRNEIETLSQQVQN